MTRALRLSVRVALLLGLLLAGAYVCAWLGLRGERLGRAVTDGGWPVPGLNPTIRGRLAIGRIDWGPSAPLDLLLGRPHQAKATGLRVFDPRGKLCLEIPEITVSVDLFALLFRGDFEVARARIPRATVILEATPVSPAATPAPQTELGLLAAFQSRHPKSTGRGPRFEIRDLAVDHIDFDLRQVDWGLHLPDASLAAGLRHDGGDVAIEGMPFSVRSRSPFDAKLRILGLDFDLRGLSLDRFGASPAHPSDLEAALTARTGEGSSLSVDGALTSIFAERTGIRMRLGLLRAGPLVARLSGLPIEGDVRVDSTLWGDLATPTIDLGATGARLATAGVTLDDVSVGVRISGKAIEIQKFGATVLGGRATAKGRLDLERQVYDAQIHADGIDPGPLVPALAGTLYGDVHLRGPMDGRSAAADFDATLRMARPAPLSREIRARGSVHLHGRTVRTDALTLSVFGAAARLRGSADLDRQWLALSVNVSGENPGRLVPALQGARGLSILGVVRGPFSRPAASGTISLRSFSIGPLTVTKISSPFDLDPDAVALPSIQARAAGAFLRADASLRDLRGAPVLDAKGEVVGLDLAPLTADAIRGTISGGLNLAGPLSDLRGRASVRSERLEVAGTTIEDLEGSVRTEGGAVHLDDFRARSGTATIRARGSLAAGGALLASLDIEGLSLNRTAPVPLGGTVTGHVELGGTLDAPKLGGRFDLFGFRLREVDLGDGHLVLEPTPDRTRIEGAFFRDRLRVEGAIGLLPLSLDARVIIDHFDMTGPLPEMRDLGFTSAPATGVITFAWDAGRGLRRADFRLQRLQVTHRDDSGHEIVVKNRRPVRVRYDEGRATIERAELISPAGNFAMEGWVERDDSDLKLRGAVTLDLAQFIWSRFVAQAHGEARVDLWLRGPLNHPNVVGSLELFGAVLVPRDLERALYLPQGRLLFSADRLVLESLVLEAGQERATFDGHLLLDKFRPTTLDVAAKGTFAAELLQIFLREHISTATGRFEVSLRAFGPWNGPTLQGEIRPKQVEIVPRRLGRVVLLSTGALRLDGRRLRFDGLGGRIDEGSVRVDGVVDLEGLRPLAVDLRIVGANCPHRVSDQYQAELNLDVSLSGDIDALLLSGQVDLVDARYIRNFQVTRLVLRPKVVEEQAPAWRGISPIERMTLALRVTSRGSVGIRNNVADIALGVSLDVGGTPDEPTFDGEVRAEGGTFHLPLLKGLYTVDGGGVAFHAGQPLEAAPVRIEGTSIVPDRTETEHEVRLLLAGTLSEMQLSLSSPGLDPGQVLSLVATGRTTEQLRHELRGESDGDGSGGGTASPGAAAADQSIKELTSDLFNEFVDPFGKLAHADMTRFEVGSESLHYMLCWRLLGKRIEACGEGDTYLAGGQRGEGRLELQIDERLTAEANAERLPQDQNSFDPDVNRLKLQLRYRHQLRF